MLEGGIASLMQGGPENDIMKGLLNVLQSKTTMQNATGCFANQIHFVTVDRRCRLPRMDLTSQQG